MSTDKRSAMACAAGQSPSPTVHPRSRLESWVIVPARPAFIGNDGWVRSDAWHWVFSSELNTTARAGGFIYIPTTSTSFSSNRGSLLTLNLFDGADRQTGLAPSPLGDLANTSDSLGDEPRTPAPHRIRVHPAVRSNSARCSTVAVSATATINRICNSITRLFRRHTTRPGRQRNLWIMQGKPRYGQLLFPEASCPSHHEDSRHGGGGRSNADDTTGHGVRVRDTGRWPATGTTRPGWRVTMNSR